MKFEECQKKVTKYLVSDDFYPRFVNLYNIHYLNNFKQYFKVGSNEFKQVEDYCKQDQNLALDSLLSDLENRQGNIFLTGFTTHFKLLGKNKLENNLSSSFKDTFPCHVVVLCYQCEEYLIDFINSDVRLDRVVYIIEGKKTPKPKLIFCNPKTDFTEHCTIVDGIQNIPTAIETSFDNTIYIKTKRHKSFYPNSLYDISEQSGAFEMLCKKDSLTETLNINYGTEEQWQYALKELSNYYSWEDYSIKEFGSNNNLHLIANNWNSYDNNKKWLHFIILKLFKSKNWYLNIAVKRAESVDSLIRCVFRSILDLQWDDKTFWQKYDERKRLLNFFGNPDSEVRDYCISVKIKQEYAIYYLTDNTYQEKELIFEILNTYSDKFDRQQILEILKNVYPDLYAYLLDFHFEQDLLNDYFCDYKYQKVINKIFPKFKNLVEQQAKKREYNLILPSRSEKIEAIEKKDTYLYFVDAMGVEFLSFIIEKCKQKNLLADITICRCELPSITSFNKGFVEIFEKGGAISIPNKNGIKDLDSIKHNRQNIHSNLPIYLIRELEIIENILDKINTELIIGNCKRAIIISDHGASRLAVINQKENKWEMATKGEHSGRCCLKSEINEQPTCATEENGFWILANYDRFKGGRKADLEVHGGATLEEITVPIIEISIKQEIEIKMLTPLIEFSIMKKNAVIKLFSKTKLNNVSVAVLGKWYKAETEDNQTYIAKLTDLKKAGDYEVDVYSNNKKIETGLKFTAEKEGFKEKKLF